ncbi:metal dependent phosphohydrolase [Methanocaldococcus vulcanius M7]|uniref:Metal dependent phosphohydrolase n=1 Tax=Methanocaldococcus vulcanius (strain ATCC 700851 / DSM 12094 / M7) TaxID=579137 RepID=C9REA4_METVM|nr:TIGR00295 family protein [Methanocaldococcus vulcanius]ACX71906.1 metal dependent phosphohydrolase [Methanocaldococcus vulcanius M7]
MDYETGLTLLKRICSPDVVEHCLAVSRYAYELSLAIKNRGYDVDVELVKLGGLLHDIGRSKTHGIEHGVVGAEILRTLGFDEKLALIAERHIGAGITKEEAIELGLPPKDYLPVSLEEKIVAHADNLIFGTKRVEIDDVIKKFERRLGRGHPSVIRILQLNDEINALLKR